MAPDKDPNFPPNLDIHPLESATSDADARFDSAAQEDAIKTYGIAGRIWYASHAMLAYLDPQSPLEFDPPPPTSSTSPGGLPPTTTKFTGGTGFVATRVAEWMHPDRDLLIGTDLPDVCEMLETNLHACPAVRVRPLAWGSREHVSSIADELGLSVGRPSPRQLTHVLCSDLIYFPALLAPLLRSLLHLTLPPLVDETYAHPASVVLSYKMRSLAKETPFWTAFGLWFEFAPVLARRRPSLAEEAQSTVEAPVEEWSRFSPGDDLDETLVIVATRRPGSMLWQIPEDDTALLAGAGAYGTDSSKSDDQFERFLLLGMDV
ncbi:uncharacterized protein TRAVEDRAFT_126360 [Trametes versicolor FP-101664 SS1]|uniref:uncharacterized protein n=1 Tax=Trametes versicolor (strain FP-101664) TaxID=717944 RepID=UPI0004622BE2|nr:uncharacterized protein TRAVEDRAFT_126360 [Trametes versicolor FP-101664 SS1]EIW57675.1 hypothetical protein TRAVEDRAFT_126360 [Trametes versicolor FP-101664 SS1]